VATTEMLCRSCCAKTLTEVDRIAIEIAINVDKVLFRHRAIIKPALDHYSAAPTAFLMSA
jgi:hypothetical protein